MDNSTLKTQRQLMQNLLRRIRIEAGLHQVDLAERLGMPQSFVSKYESGDRRLDLLEVRLVCLAIGIPLFQFIRKLEDLLNETN